MRAHKRASAAGDPGGTLGLQGGIAAYGHLRDGRAAPQRLRGGVGGPAQGELRIKASAGHRGAVHPAMREAAHGKLLLTRLRGDLGRGGGRRRVSRGGSAGGLPSLHAADAGPVAGRGRAARVEADSGPVRVRGERGRATLLLPVRGARFGGGGCPQRAGLGRVRVSGVRKGASGGDLRVSTSRPGEGVHQKGNGGRGAGARPGGDGGDSAILGKTAGGCAATARGRRGAVPPAAQAGQAAGRARRSARGGAGPLCSGLRAGAPGGI